MCLKNTKMNKINNVEIEVRLPKYDDGKFSCCGKKFFEMYFTKYIIHKLIL